MINQKLVKNLQEQITENKNDINNIKRKVLWSNPDLTSSFPAQTITLSESLNNYEYYEIIFKQSTTNERNMTSGKIPVGHGTILSYANSLRATSSTVGGTTFAFENASNNGNADSGSIIPIYIIGYKA